MTWNEYKRRIVQPILLNLWVLGPMILVVLAGR